MAIIDNSQGKPNLEVFAETLEALAREDKNVVAVTSDSRGSGKLAPFAHRSQTCGNAHQILFGNAHFYDLFWQSLSKRGKFARTTRVACDGDRKSVV